MTSGTSGLKRFGAICRPSAAGRSAAPRATLAAIALAGTGCIVASPAIGQDKEAASPAVDHLAEVKACRAIAEPEARLACFDASVATMVAATESGELKVVDRESVQKARRSLFGFATPSLGIFGSDDDEANSLLESQITSVRQIRRNSWIITITEGSKWQISNAPMRLRPPRPGDPVVLKSASLGSFFIRIAGQTGVKGRRIE